jgi:hypothetical protein
MEVGSCYPHFVGPWIMFKIGMALMRLGVFVSLERELHITGFDGRGGEKREDGKCLVNK